MFKQTGRFTDHLGMLGMARDARLLVGHLRWATHGSPSDNLNNHPHPVDGGWLVHNGVVHNATELARERRLWPISECDSETIGLLVERLEGSRLGRSANAARLTDGNLATLSVWSRPNTLVAVRRGNPLHIGRDDSGTYLATLPSQLPGRVESVRDNCAVQFSPRDGIIHVTRRFIAPPIVQRSLFAGSGPYRGGQSCQ